VGLPAKTDDPEVAELRRRLVSLPMESQARVLEGVLTPGLRLRVLAEQVRHQAGLPRSPGRGTGGPAVRLGQGPEQVQRDRIAGGPGQGGSGTSGSSTSGTSTNGTGTSGTGASGTGTGVTGPDTTGPDTTGPDPTGPGTGRGALATTAPFSQAAFRRWRHLPRRQCGKSSMIFRACQH